MLLPDAPKQLIPTKVISPSTSREKHSSILSPYEIACYAAGFREFEIPYDVLP